MSNPILDKLPNDARLSLKAEAAVIVALKDEAERRFDPNDPATQILLDDLLTFAQRLIASDAATQELNGSAFIANLLGNVQAQLPPGIYEVVEENFHRYLGGEQRHILSPVDDIERMVLDMDATIPAAQEQEG